MQSIIECDKCGYSRASDQDGQMFHEVCGICYQDTCETPTSIKELCTNCLIDENDGPIIDSGESLLT